MLLPELRDFLTRFGISVKLWGKGEARTVEDLLSEINEDECYLRIDRVGVYRVTEIVKMYIFDPLVPARGYLIEHAQYLPDGRLRERKQHPSGKIKNLESPEACLVRELNEELNLHKDQYSFEALDKKMESRSSRSYPGLSCIYIVHPFRVELRDCGLVHCQEDYEVRQADGTRQIFKWEGIPRG